MLVVKLNKTQFEYDIHSIVKAFYPEKDVKVLTPDSVVKDKEWFHKEPDMHIDFAEEKIEVKAQGLHCMELDILNANYKDEFKKFLYRCLCKETGKTLPWGNLTGIRPTKIAMGMLENGQSEKEIISYMEEDVGSGSASKHTCESCSKEGTHAIEGFSGYTEYYCTEHYNEMIEILEMILGEQNLQRTTYLSSSFFMHELTFYRFNATLSEQTREIL